MTPTVILTRPRAQSDSFAARLRAAWKGPLTVITAPLIEIVPVAATCPTADAVIFTSSNGVLAAGRLGLPPGLTAWCVGSKTAEQAKQAGFVPITGPGDADGLVAKIIRAKPSGNLAHVRGRHARGDVANRLNAAGIPCQDIIAYDQVALSLTQQAKSALTARASAIFPMFSPRTASILNDEGPFSANIHVIALSEAVKSAISPDIAQQITLTERPDGNAMLAATLHALQVYDDRK